MKHYKVAIIGCGSIGALKPNNLDSKTSKYPLTHAHAIYNNKKTVLTCMIDQNIEQAHRAADKWETDKNLILRSNSLYLDTDGKRRPIITDEDIVIIATPTSDHFSVAMEIIQIVKPKVIILEKPAAENLLDIGILKRKSELLKIPIIVNYTRSFEPFHKEVAKKMREGSFGEIYACRCLYGRGLKREASHAVNFFNNSLGKCFSVVSVTKGYYDLNKEDPSLNILLRYEKCKNVSLVSIDSESGYGVFEIDILHSQGRITFIENGVYCYMYETKQEEVYGTYPVLDQRTISSFKTNLTFCLDYLVNNAIEVIEGKEEPICSIEDALDVYKVFNLIDLNLETKERLL